MKQMYLLLLCVLLSSSGLLAQLPDGSTAPNWTLTDLDGVSHTLYDVLDSDKSAIIDFSATWCPPCWSYHQTHILEDMYKEYGPGGSVNPNQIEVYYIESDDATNDACMTNSAGCTGGTQGDWTAGTSYPLFNPPTEAVPSQYQINAYPTLIAVCPNRKLYEVGQASKSTWESWLFQTCALDQSFLAVNEVCAGDGNGAIDLSVTGGAGTVTYSWSNGANTQDLSGLAQGTYSCTITEGRGHSIETGPIEIAGPASPVSAANEQVTQVSCSGDGNGSISLTGSGGAGSYSYAWSNGESTASINSLDGGDYSVTITDLDGCTFEETYSVAEPPLLTGSYNAVPASCGNSNGLLSMTADGGTGPFNYDIGIDNNSSGVFLNLPPGMYDAVITDANNCSFAFPLEVGNLPSPTAVASGTGMITCANNTLELSGEGSTEGSFIDYTWSTTDGEIVEGESTLYPVISAPGTYTLEVLDGQTGCVETSTVTIEGDVAAPVAMSNDAGVIDCANTQATLDGTGSDTGDNISYLWTTENGNIVEGATELIAQANAGGTYTLIVTNNDNGCTATSMVTIEQTAELPVSDAGAQQALTCVTSEVTLDGSNSSAGDNYTYTWTTDDGTIVSGENTPMAVVNASGTYLLEVFNNDNGCSALSSVMVVIDQAIPEASIANPAMLTCELEEQTLSIDVNLDVAYTLEWTTEDGNIVSGEDTDQPLIDAPGVYNVLIINSENGCSTTEMITVEEFINTPMAAFDYSKDDKVFTFADNSVGSPTMYLWDFGDMNTSNEAAPVHEYAENGDYEVCLTITNECGENMTCTTVTVSAGAALEYELSTDDATCNAECDGVYDLVPVEDVENYTVTVTGPNGFESNAFSLSDLCNGTYNFTLTNDIGESIDGTFDIAQPAAITIATSQVVNIDCFGNQNGSIALELEGGTGDIEITWNTGDAGNEIVDLESGTYTATGVDANGCTQTFDFIVDEPTQLELEDSEVMHIDDTNPTGSIEIEIEGGTPGYTFLWSSGEDTQNIDGLEVGEYSVIVTDANGCKEEFGPFTVQSIIAVVEIEGLELFNIQPNPATEFVNIALEFDTNQSAEISIVNNLGQIVSTSQREGKAVNYRQDVQDLASGLYFVQVTVGSQSTIKKLVVE